MTAGESHGPRLVALVEGIPGGLPMLASDIDEDLARRQRGYGRGGRTKIETDRVELGGGVRDGSTLRPGHADLAGGIKYDRKDLRDVLERSDICAEAAAPMVGEAMVAITLCDALLEKLGSDSVRELVRNVDAHRAQIEAF